ncbi:MAG: alpha/beta fold hydrolase, partial [Ilumatobacteraceae bacterium]
TSGWECSTLGVPMDPFGDRPDLPPVALALTRHRATGDRRGALVMNPGGPGGSGLEAAWGIRPGMPADVLRAYDIVSWDPRGVGSSTPAIDCGPDPDPNSEGFIEACADGTGDLAAYLSAPYSSADLEAIRVALGEEQLDYLGYSYGTIIGATFAADHPDRVGHFVLDGTTDPLVGGDDGVTEDGFPYYASDGVPAATERFAELCDLSDACLGDVGADTQRFLVELGRSVAELPTDDFPGEPATVDSYAFDGVLQTALSYAADWPLFATALRDARDGDASALAALAAEDPVLSDDATSERAGPSFIVANLVIYCADFGDRIEGSTFCDPLPANEFTVAPVAAVDVDRPILVIGTEFDPITPGYHAADFSDALGDAFHVVWEGVGHTAFPGSSRCIDQIVSDQLLDGPLPQSGTRCTFVDGVADETELAGDLFEHDRTAAAGWIAGVQEDLGTDVDTATCIGREVVSTSDDRTISHVVLGVDSDAATAMVGAAIGVC